MNNRIADKGRPQVTEVLLGEPGYPGKLEATLGRFAPKELYCMGNLELLNTVSVGFCGSRNASDKGLETAFDCSEQLSKKAITIVSGYAAGVDLKAHFSALSSGGNTIMVLAEGTDHFRIKKELRSVWSWDRVLVVSQFAPAQRWQPFRAMTRNKTIIGLCAAMVVIEAGETGGTLAAGLSTLKLNLPLFVVEYADMGMTAPGNQKLLGLGGRKLRKSRTSGQAKLGPLLEALEPPEQDTTTESIQQTLF